MMSPLLSLPICRGSTRWRNAVAKKQGRLLAEFLRTRSAPKLANAEEETASRALDIGVENRTALSDDLLYQVFTLLPAESLFRLQFVCKQWFGLISSSVFVTSHAQQSETVLISQESTLWPQGSEEKPKSYFHFLNLDDEGSDFVESSVAELVDIRASYDGLVLATTEKSKGLILMNPVTRKHIGLPLGSVCKFSRESFGIAFCDQEKTYKVVHLFREKSRSSGCEILSICRGNWRRIEGPSFGLLIDISQIPVSIGGSLHWLFSRRGCDDFVSMNVHDETFISRKLPVGRGSKDRLLEIEGNLGFVTHAQPDLLQVWTLITEGESSESWMKRHSINLNVEFRNCIPICGSRNGEEIVLECPVHQLHVYNFGRGVMKLVHSRFDNATWFARMDQLYIPHRNTLVSCEDRSSVYLVNEYQEL